MGIFDENIKTGQDFEKTLVEGSKEELNELKAWLFKENIRVETEKMGKTASHKNPDHKMG